MWSKIDISSHVNKSWGFNVSRDEEEFYFRSPS